MPQFDWFEDGFTTDFTFRIIDGISLLNIER